MINDIDIIEPVESPIFNSNDYIYEMKYKGIRVLIIINNNIKIIDNKKSDITYKFPELLDLKDNIKSNCILDGVIVLKNNKKFNKYYPQTRYNLTNKSIIINYSLKRPVNLMITDILYFNDKSLLTTPLIVRKKIINKNFKSNNKLFISKYLYNSPDKLINNIYKYNLNSVIAKYKYSLYEQNTWNYFKIYLIDEFYICGLTFYENDIKELIICDSNQKYKGKVKLTGYNIKKYLLHITKPYRTSKSIISNLENTLFIKPVIKCLVEYLTVDKNDIIIDAFLKKIIK